MGRKPRVRNVELGKRIKELRNRRGLTQAQLGKLMGVTQPTVNKWEDGKGLDSTTIKRLAEVFNVNTSEMVDGFHVDEKFSAALVRSFTMANPERRTIVCDVLRLQPPENKDLSGVNDQE